MRRPLSEQSPAVIKLFVTDIDGCLAEPYQPYDLEGISTFRDFVEQAGSLTENGSVPAVSVCSGRPYPYVEAVTQALDHGLIDLAEDTYRVFPVHFP